MKSRPKMPRSTRSLTGRNADVPAADRSTWQLLLSERPDFWRLWSVGLVVFTVRWLETVAVGVFVYQQSQSAFLVAMMTMLRLLPMGLFGLVIGAWVERIDRRLILILVVMLMLLTSASL